MEIVKIDFFDIDSLSIADTKEFGIMRIITDDNEKAVKAEEILIKAGAKVL